MPARNVGKKIVTKNAKTRFLYSHEYRDQKVGGKMRETIFPETHEQSVEKMLGKKSQKSVKKRFLYSHEYREHKIGGKNARNNFFRNTRIVRAKNVLKKSLHK